MANTASATAQTTPPRNVNSEPQLKSTPYALGSAAVSENIGTLGVEVADVRPWIGRDVCEYSECNVDTMLEELLYRCIDPSKPAPDKSTLLDDTLKAVLPLCNEGEGARDIKKHLTDFVNCPAEPKSYKPFVKAANRVLDQLRGLKAPGLLPSKSKDDKDTILFHQNDPSYIKQTHQGAEAQRKPDVVIVSYKSAQRVCSGEVYDKASSKPQDNFKWTDVRSLLEFKRSAKHSMKVPPPTYAGNPYDVPTGKKYMKYRKETDDPAEPAGPTPVPVSDAATSSNLPGPSNQSGQLKSKGGIKRSSDHLHSTEPKSKRVKSNNETKRKEKESTKLHPVVQNGLYAAEMFAAHIARQNVISYVVQDDIIYIWYFDRQNAIQCSGFNFIQDLPRFMVLLLAMQRMRYADWGYHPIFESEPESSGEVVVEDDVFGEVDLKFDLTSEERTTHYGLRGRATNVFPVESKKLSTLVPELPHYNPHNPTKELVAKLYWPEDERESEAEILERVNKVAANEPRVRGHVPEMIWFHKFKDTSTAKIRNALGIKGTEGGRRVLYIIVFRKLLPITQLSDQEFLSAWWQIVVAHYALWQEGVHHRDVSPNNLMVYETSDGRWIGVLNDFDLSSTRDVPQGQERTGTVPFMALDLLTKEAIDGNVKHLYWHDAESLIWVLAWVCLRYKDKKLLSHDRPLDDWLRVDAIQCRKEKYDFLGLGRRRMEASSSHLSNWIVARRCLGPVAKFYAEDTLPTLRDEFVFQTWLEKYIPLEAKQLPLLQD